MKQNIIVLGGDGFCGWPTSLFLSSCGYNVTIVDNLSRRKIDIDLGLQSLTPIKSIQERIEAWKSITDKTINFENIDISTEYDKLYNLIDEIKPLAIVHFAEQRAAPYSMKTPWHKRYTVNNNTNATNNVLCAISELKSDIHLVHLGTTGFYGYSSIGMEIPEGYLTVKVDVDGVEKEMEIMYPANPGSIYHMTKCQDAISFFYYNKNDGIRITDLHQGIVWGTQTEETSLDERLINRFDYDGDYGTVLNRFLMQSQIDFPLTVHGTGGQTRAFINLKDTVKCVKFAIENPPGKDEKVKIINQTTECMEVRDLALIIQNKTKCKINYLKNPRKEDPKNALRFNMETLKKIGFEPTTLNDGLLEEIINIAKKYKDRCDKSKIICTSTWDGSVY